MRAVFQQELSEVQSRLVSLAETSEKIMDKASRAFLNSDVSMADEALALAEANEERALDLDELVIKVLATQSPVARDLRILVSALRMSASLERMAHSHLTLLLLRATATQEARFQNRCARPSRTWRELTLSL